MAKLDKSFVVIRFGFGEGDVKGRQRTDDTYRYKVRQIAVRYADVKFEEVRKVLTDGAAADVRRELVNMASRYRRHIIGANGARATPAGVLRNTLGGASPLTLSSALPAWAPRDAKYLKRKFDARAGSGWFDNRGWSRRPGQTWQPNDTGLLFKSMRAEVWEQMFGPISVRFERRFDPNKEASASIGVGGGDHVKLQLGTLYVNALGKLTPQMLPALNMTGGQIPMASDAGNDGLMGLVSNYSQPLAYRLGQRSTITKRYRPTLEPFLSYFLTRSIPAAIARRLQQGSMAALKKA